MSAFTYSLVTSPRQLKASAQAGTLGVAKLQIALATESVTPVGAPVVAVAVPVGPDADDLAADGQAITTAAPVGWTSATVDGGRVTFTPPKDFVIDAKHPATLTLGVEINTAPGSGVVVVTDDSGSTVELPFAKAWPLEPLLTYEISPHRVHVTEADGTPAQTTFTVMISNAQKEPITLSELDFRVPVGDNGDDLTSDSALDVGHPGTWRRLGTSLTFVPTAASSLFQLDPHAPSLTFTFNDVTVNAEAGMATITVFECGAAQRYPSCPSYAIDVAKFPIGLDVADPKLSADPGPVVSAGDTITLHWSAPQGPTYTLYCDDEMVSGVIGNVGERQFRIDGRTMFTLVGAIAVGAHSAHTTAQLQVDARAVGIAFASVTGTVDREARTLAIAWQTNKSDGQVTFDDVDTPYPLDRGNGKGASRRGIPLSDTWDQVTLDAKDFHTETTARATARLRWNVLGVLQPLVYVGDDVDQMVPSPVARLRLALSRRRSELLWAQSTTVGTCAVTSDVEGGLTQGATALTVPAGSAYAGVYGLAPVRVRDLDQMLVHRVDDRGEVIVSLVPAQLTRSSVGVGNLAPVGMAPPQLPPNGLALAAARPDGSQVFLARDQHSLDVCTLMPLPGAGVLLSHQDTIKTGYPIAGLAIASDGTAYIAHGNTISVVAPNATQPAQAYGLGWIGAVKALAVSDTALFVATADGRIRVFDRNVRHVAPNGPLREIAQEIRFATSNFVVTDDGLTIYAVRASGDSIATLAPVDVAADLAPHDPAPVRPAPLVG